MTSLVAFLILAQGPAAEAVLGPAAPAGSNEAFQKLFLHVQEKLEAGDFEGAKKLHRLLPKQEITMAWDDSAVPAAHRPAFVSARDRALQTWRQGMPNFEVKAVPHKKGAGPGPEILVSFAPDLPLRPGEALTPAAVHFFSEDPAEPRLETVISLKRDNPPVLPDFADIHNEVGFSLMQYYGLERAVNFTLFSGRTELSTTRPATLGTGERLQVKMNLDAGSVLAKHLMKSQRVIPAKPRIHVDPMVFDGGNVTQGEIVKFSFQVSNLGNAPLYIRAQPDCSCVSAERQTLPLEPGETRLVRAQIDLHDVVGEFDKSILIYSNDLEKTVQFMPIRVKSKALFRLIPENEGHVLMSKGGKRAKVYMVLPESTKLKPTAARFDGIPAKVTYKPWSGTLADPDQKEPALPRQGYLFEVDLNDDLPPGRAGGSLWIETDDPRYKEVVVNLSVQKGIVALPDQVRLGEIPAAPRRAAFLVSRPTKGFGIKKVEVDSPYLSATAIPVREGWEYRVNVQFSGKAPAGVLAATISVHTDDPEQPVIKVPFHTIVQ